MAVAVSFAGYSFYLIRRISRVVTTPGPPGASLRAMDHDPISYEAMFEGAGIDGESLSVVLVRGGTRAKVLALLGAEPESIGDHSPDLEEEEEEEEEEEDDYSAYALTEVQGGVIAFEHTGYADPSPRVLAALSELGGAAAVTRSNIQAHERFGCATDGVLVFDADEFMYVEKDALPRELLPMFESVWVDLGGDGDDGDHEDAGGFVAYAMAAKHTGVVVTSDDLRRAVQQGYHRVPTLTYLE